MQISESFISFCRPHCFDSGLNSAQCPGQRSLFERASSEIEIVGLQSFDHLWRGEVSDYQMMFWPSVSVIPDVDVLASEVDLNLVYMTLKGAACDGAVRV